MYHPKFLFNELEKKEEKERLAILRAAEAAMYKKSLFLTCKHLLGYSDINWRTHGEAIEVLEGPKKRKLVIMPRGTFKTSMAVVGFPIWSLINNFDLRVMLDSELYSNAKRSLREISMHLQSPKFVELFGNPRGEGVWNEGEILLAQRRAIKKEASIFASGIGAEKTGVHVDIIIADDLCSPSNMNTPENRQKVIDHYRYYTSILEPGGTIVVVGTRYHSADLYAWLLENEIFLRDDEAAID